MVAVSAEAGVPSIRAQAETRKAELKDNVRADPLVQAVLARFPGAEIVDVRARRPVSAGRPTDSDDDAGSPSERKRSRCLIFSA